MHILKAMFDAAIRLKHSDRAVASLTEGALTVRVAVFRGTGTSGPTFRVTLIDRGPPGYERRVSIESASVGGVVDALIHETPDGGLGPLLATTWEAADGVPHGDDGP